MSEIQRLPKAFLPARRRKSCSIHSYSSPSVKHYVPERISEPDHHPIHWYLSVDNEVILVFHDPRHILDPFAYNLTSKLPLVNRKSLSYAVDFPPKAGYLSDLSPPHFIRQSRYVRLEVNHKYCGAFFIDVSGTSPPTSLDVIYPSAAPADVRHFVEWTSHYVDYSIAGTFYSSAMTPDFLYDTCVFDFPPAPPPVLHEFPSRLYAPVRLLQTNVSSVPKYYVVVRKICTSRESNLKDVFFIDIETGEVCGTYEGTPVYPEMYDPEVYYPSVGFMHGGVRAAVPSTSKYPSTHFVFPRLDKRGHLLDQQTFYVSSSVSHQAPLLYSFLQDYFNFDFSDEDLYGYLDTSCFRDPGYSEVSLPPRPLTGSKLTLYPNEVIVKAVSNATLNRDLVLLWDGTEEFSGSESARTITSQGVAIIGTNGNFAIRGDSFFHDTMKLSPANLRFSPRVNDVGDFWWKNVASPNYPRWVRQTCKRIREAPMDWYTIAVAEEYIDFTEVALPGGPTGLSSHLQMHLDAAFRPPANPLIRYPLFYLTPFRWYEFNGSIIIVLVDHTHPPPYTVSDLRFFDLASNTLVDTTSQMIPASGNSQFCINDFVNNLYFSPVLHGWSPYIRENEFLYLRKKYEPGVRANFDDPQFDTLPYDIGFAEWVYDYFDDSPFGMEMATVSVDVSDNNCQCVDCFINKPTDVPFPGLSEYPILSVPPIETFDFTIKFDRTIDFFNFLGLNTNWSNSTLQFPMKADFDKVLTTDDPNMSKPTIYSKRYQLSSS